MNRKIGWRLSLLMLMIGTGFPGALTANNDTASVAIASHPGDAKGKMPHSTQPARTVQSSSGVVVRNLASGFTYSSIQEAIDDQANGNHFRLEVPEHTEGQIVVSGFVTLSGMKGGSVIKMAENTGDVGDDRGWFHVLPGATLQVQDLTFDGNGKNVYQAFRHEGKGFFENTHFRDINYPLGFSDQSGFAIVAFGGQVDVSNSSFANIGQSALFYFGSGFKGVALDNRFVGKGDVPDLNFGIEIGGGALVAMERNHFSGFSGEVAGTNSAGLLVTESFGEGSAVDALSNTFVHNRIGVYVLDTPTVNIRVSRFSNNSIRAVHDQDGANPNATYSWWGCNLPPGTCAQASDTVLSDPYMKVKAWASPTNIDSDQSTTISVSFNQSSDGSPLPAGRLIQDGTPVEFRAQEGTYCASRRGTINGATQAVFIPPATNFSLLPQVRVDSTLFPVQITVTPAGENFQSLECLPVFEDSFEE